MEAKELVNRPGPKADLSGKPTKDLPNDDVHILTVPYECVQMIVLTDHRCIAIGFGS